MDSMSKPVDRLEVSIPLRPLAQIAVAIVLAFPTAIAGHLLGFAMAVVGDIEAIPLGSFLYAMGEGVAASICFAMFLSRFRASVPTRVWCWLAATVLLVLALPSLSVLSLQYFRSESIHFASICILFAMAFLLWLAWLPWWQPSWLMRGHADR